MTDRELLEKAAKAAGLMVRCVGNGEPNAAFSFYTEPDQLWWNPLADDGDALRLAVKLDIDIFGGAAGFRCCETNIDVYSERSDGDPYAAARRAIVRAAAAMGGATASR